MDRDGVTDFFEFLQSQETAQIFLHQRYKKLEVHDAEAKSYRNVPAFIAYITHGDMLYRSAGTLPFAIRPMIYFYGLIHLLKASILTERPDYPESTAMLAHGVSSRKRKKRNYTFLDDEVRIQYQGLFPYASSHLYHIKNMPFEKISMYRLLALIPELDTMFGFYGEQNLMQIDRRGEDILDFPKSLLDTYHLTERAFIERIKTRLPVYRDIKVEADSIQVLLEEPLRVSFNPFLLHGNKDTIYFPKKRELFFPMPEVMIHYLLLYNLSMLSRYSTEWWSELHQHKPDMDYPMIARFLSITAEKTPRLIAEELYHVFHSSGRKAKEDG